MNIIHIQTPSDKPNEWRDCQLVKVNSNNKTDSAEVKVKGVARHENVTTLIIINDLSDFINGEEVRSLHGYFKLRINEESKHLFSPGLQEPGKLLNSSAPTCCAVQPSAE